jgi:hypothetical protein
MEYVGAEEELLTNIEFPSAHYLVENKNRMALHMSSPACQLRYLSPSSLQSKTKRVLLVFIIYQINQIHDKSILTHHKLSFQLFITYIDSSQPTSRDSCSMSDNFQHTARNP